MLLLVYFIRKVIYLPLFFIFSRFFPYIPKFIKGGNYLDVGCGKGSYLYLLRTWGWGVYGVEPNKEAARNAANCLGLDIFNGMLEESNFKENFFDVVNLNHALEHVHDPGAVLDRIRIILRKNGLLVIRVPNAKSLPGYIIGRKLALAEDIPRHLFIFDKTTVKKLLEKNGFKVMNIRFDPRPQTLTGSYKHLLPKNSITFILYEKLEKLLAPLLACCFFLTSMLPIGNSMTIWAGKKEIGERK